MPSHAERRIVPYHAEDLFDLVADVAQYPKFLPWCVAARVRKRDAGLMLADLTIGFGPFRESFSSRVELTRPADILVRYENGPFRHLRNHWRFQPVAAGTEVDFGVDFAFRSRVLEAAIGVVFHDAVRRMVDAFLRRAEAVYGVEPAGAVTAITQG
jgi:coenzyme Q-binding protein COQ10